MSRSTVAVMLAALASSLAACRAAPPDASADTATTTAGPPATSLEPPAPIRPAPQHAPDTPVTPVASTVPATTATAPAETFPPVVLPTTTCEAADELIGHDIAYVTNEPAYESGRANDEHAIRELLAHLAAVAPTDDAIDPAVAAALASAANELSAADLTASGQLTPLELSTVRDLDSALRAGCLLRLSGIGVLSDAFNRPTVSPESGAGLVRLPDDVCGLGATISWLDDRLGRTAQDDPRFDELAVSLRHALGSVSYGAQDPVEAGWDDAPFWLGEADLATPADFTDEQVAAVSALNRAMQAECGFGLGAEGLLAQAVAPGEIDVAAVIEAPEFEPPSELEPGPRFCAIADELFVRDIAYVTAEPYEFAQRYRVSVSLRRSLGALRLTARSLDPEIDDSTEHATRIVERADMSESGWFTDIENEAVAELDTTLRTVCGLGLSVHGLLRSGG